MNGPRFALIALAAVTAWQWSVNGWLGVAVCLSGFLAGYFLTRRPQ